MFIFGTSQNSSAASSTPTETQTVDIISAHNVYEAMQTNVIRPYVDILSAYTASQGPSETPSAQTQNVQTPSWLQVQILGPSDFNPGMLDAFSRLAKVEPSPAVPAGMEDLQWDPCRQATCGVRIPAWSIVAIVGGWDLGDGFTQVPGVGNLLILENVGAEDIYFPATQVGSGFYTLFAYPNGDPQPLADTTFQVANFLSNWILHPDRTQSEDAYWVNQCSYKGCDSVKIGGYQFVGTGTPTQFFATTVTK